MRAIRRELAVFGDVRMIRVYCGRCQGMTLVRNNIKLCCDEPAEIKRIRKVKIECNSIHTRRKPSKKRQREILKAQNNKCLYCGQEFGNLYCRNHKILPLKINFDHLLPYSYQRNNKNNFVAACHICNGIKSNKIFNTVEEVFYYVKYQREKKGITYLEDVSTVQEEVSVQE